MSRDTFSTKNEKFSESEIKELKKVKKKEKIQGVEKPFQLILLFQIIFILLSIVFLFVSTYVYLIERSFWAIGCPTSYTWSSEHLYVLGVKFKLFNFYAAFINILILIYGIELNKFLLLGIYSLPFLVLNLIGLTTAYYIVLEIISLITEIKIYVDLFILLILAIIYYKKIYRGHTRLTLVILFLIYLNLFFLGTPQGVRFC